MGKAIFVFGSAGSGKTTFCSNFKQQCTYKMRPKLVNLDPAQEYIGEYDVDLCSYITVKDVMKEYDYGPNGGLFIALQELVDDIDELELSTFDQNLLIFDCPGQIELFLHSKVLLDCIKHVKSFADVLLVYLFDSTNFINSDKHIFTKLIAALSVGRFELPVINVITKMDLFDYEKQQEIIEISQNDPSCEGDKFKTAVCEFLEYNGLNNYIYLNWEDEDTVNSLFTQLDLVLQIEDDEDRKPVDFE